MESEKAETVTLRTQLTSMKFDGIGSVREHILRMVDLSLKLKDLEVPVCTILDQSRNYRAPANAILSRTQKSSPPTRRPITTQHVSRLEANQSAARVNIKNQS
ncbi:hypothetical protein ACFXTI_032642 [Malus domestica]